MGDCVEGLSANARARAGEGKLENQRVQTVVRHVGHRLDRFCLDVLHRVFPQDALELRHRGCLVAIPKRLDGFALDRHILVLPDDARQRGDGPGRLDIA